MVVKLILSDLSLPSPDDREMSDADERKRWPITEELLERIRQEADRQGKTNRDLATAGGVSDGAISQLRNQKNYNIKTSIAVPGICQLLGIDLAEYLTPDELQRAMLRALDRLRRAYGESQAQAFTVEVETLRRRIMADLKERGVEPIDTGVIEEEEFTPRPM